jgi:hypothetical protein
MFGVHPSRAEEIEELAETHALRALGGRNLPVDVRSILNDHGVFIFHPPPDAPFEAELNLGRRPFTLEIKRVTGSRARFTIAHELGHLLLHADVSLVHRETASTVIDSLENNGTALAEIETEANAFAAGLLMPRGQFLTDIRELEEPTAVGYGTWLDELTRKYDVSRSAAMMRLARLRDRAVLTGFAWSDSGKIIYMIPNLELEMTATEVATLAWRCCQLVPGHRRRWLPQKAFAPIRNELLQIPNAEAAVVKSQSAIRIRDIFPELRSALVGEIFICGCDINCKKLYFEIVLENGIH